MSSPVGGAPQGREFDCPHPACRWIMSGLPEADADETPDGLNRGDVVICLGCRRRLVFASGRLWGETPEESERHLLDPEIVRVQVEVMLREDTGLRALFERSFS